MDRNQFWEFVRSFNYYDELEIEIQKYALSMRRGGDAERSLRDLILDAQSWLSLGASFINSNLIWNDTEAGFAVWNSRHHEFSRLYSKCV